MKKLMDKIKHNIKGAISYSVHTWIFKCFLIAFGMEFILEVLGRRSILAGLKFMFFSPIVYLYNVTIILFTLLFALFLRKRVFGIAIICVLWLICGIVNFVILGYRVTPFAAIDFLMIKDAFSMIDIYLKKWQEFAIVIGIIVLIIGIIVLFIKTPKFEGAIHIKATMLACVIVWGIVVIFTNFSVKHNIISDDFANLGMAYKDYGFAYCFTNSIIDNGIKEPDNYSEDTMKQIKSELDTVKPTEEKQTPNIIVIQLESFFNIKTVKDLQLSADPTPYFTALKEKYPSGFLTVPALGAGTANTEFEVLTGIRSNFFGAGEYPYKTTVNDTPVEGMCSILKREGYGAYAIHNNKGSFYDRQNVYDEMGFDAFISLEYMYDVDYTSTGWAKDATLVEDIMKCLKDTETSDLVYTISVQGHGRYPDIPDACDDNIQVLSYSDEEMINQIHYYVNQIYDMDIMIGNLIDKLDEYGEDYVLILYGDHLPTLNFEEEQLSEGNLFQTEYIIVNNIGLSLCDEDIASYELSGKLFDALGIEAGYAQKCQEYYRDEEDMLDKLCLIAYDMLFGNKFIYNGRSPVVDTEMRDGIDVISVTEANNQGDHLVVKGENFNEFSVVFCDGESFDTVFVDRQTLYVDNENVKSGDSITVKQVDESHHVISSSAEYIY